MLPYLSLALALLGLVKAVLRYITSLNSPDATRAKIILAALEFQDARIQAAITARDDALAQFDATGTSDDSRFRD